VRVVQITDTHVPADPADASVVGWLAGVELHDPVSTLTHVLRDIDGLEARPDLIVATGDLADRGHPASYRRLNGMLNDLGIPTIVLPGNHDLPDELDATLPGGCVELASVVQNDGWTFAFARTGNTEWGELGAEQVGRLSREIDRLGGPVFLWQHHPPIALVPGYLADNDFLIEDDGALIDRHDVRGIAVGHVHSHHDREFRGVPLHATPSTFMGAPGPGYRIFEFGKNDFRTEVRAFPELMALGDEARARLRAISAERADVLRAITVTRGDEPRARAEVLEWRHAADEQRGRAPASY
jgi:3',5'-cyclic-AMP phosphodiesterase